MHSCVQARGCIVHSILLHFTETAGCNLNSFSAIIPFLLDCLQFTTSSLADRALSRTASPQQHIWSSNGRTWSTPTTTFLLYKHLFSQHATINLLQQGQCQCFIPHHCEQRHQSAPAVRSWENQAATGAGLATSAKAELLAELRAPRRAEMGSPATPSTQQEPLSALENVIYNPHTPKKPTRHSFPLKCNQGGFWCETFPWSENISESWLFLQRKRTLGSSSCNCEASPAFIPQILRWRQAPVEKTGMEISSRAVGRADFSCVCDFQRHFDRP